ncbi:MAG TPA: hypothetical protein VGH54_09595 [Mycobacterium sp.]|jgi:hypothetical protein|uniref:PKD domain-containing protein n=1 Tax=Mycobacterium sp. TaxID=1785 RepID=UPI002F400A9E
MTTTVTAQVAAGGDDLSWHNEGTGAFSTTSVSILIGDSSSTDFNRWGLARIAGLTIPVGAAITEAHATLKAVGLSGTIPALTIYGVKGDNPAAPATRAAANALTLTTASVAWTPSAWVAGTSYQTPDLKTIIQEIVNQGTWGSGEAIVLVFTVPRGDAFVAANAVSFRSYDNVPADAAQVSVTYSTAFAGTANAGPDQTDIVPFATVTLDGTASTGSPSVYQWEQISGPAVTLSSTSAAQPTFTAPADIAGATLVFGLKVGDGSTLSSEDTVQITIKPHDLFVRKSDAWVPAQWMVRKSSAWV